MGYDKTVRAVNGSSPRMRGTQPRENISIGALRFIPCESARSDAFLW